MTALGDQGDKDDDYMPIRKGRRMTAASKDFYKIEMNEDIWLFYFLFFTRRFTGYAYTHPSEPSRGSFINWRNSAWCSWISLKSWGFCFPSSWSMGCTRHSSFNNETLLAKKIIENKTLRHQKASRNTIKKWYRPVISVDLLAPLIAVLETRRQSEKINKYIYTYIYSVTS